LNQRNGIRKEKAKLPHHSMMSVEGKLMFTVPESVVLLYQDRNLYEISSLHIHLSLQLCHLRSWFRCSCPRQKSYSCNLQFILGVRVFPLHCFVQLLAIQKVAAILL